MILKNQMVKNSKTEMVAEPKNSDCDKNQKIKLRQPNETNCDKTQKLKMWQISNCDKTPKFKLWQNLKTQIVTKLKSLNCDITWLITNINLWGEKN